MRDRKQREKKQKGILNELQCTVKVKGMMCEHCEARVKKALEALEQVERAEADHKTGTVEVVLNASIEKKVLKKAVENEDYKVLAIK